MNCYKNPILSLLSFASALALMANSTANAFTVQIIADNDFALLVGTNTEVTRLVYQNDVSWPSQLDTASSFNFELQSGETTFYLLALGGGGAEENISGTINSVNIVQMYLDATTAISQSSNITPYLSGYNLSDVDAGTYSITVGDVNAALSSGTVTWSEPNVDGSQNVIWQNPEAYLPAYDSNLGFSFDTGNAVLYKFSVETANVPEPSSAVLMSLGLIPASVLIRRRRNS